MSKQFERGLGKLEVGLLSVVAVVVAIAWLVSRLTGD